MKRISHVADLVARRAKEHQVVVVLSAMSGETDKLLSLAREITASPDPRELDMLLTCGEQKTISLLSLHLLSRGLKSKALLGSQIKIITDADHTCARIESIEDLKIKEILNLGGIAIVPGFQGVTASGEITTLGRGGSDTSAVALAAALQADVCDIYTDVEGVYTTDPNMEPKAQKLSQITYDEMLELASLGAKVLQTRSVEFAKRYNVPLQVRSTFKEVPGTWVKQEVDEVESLVVSGITYTKNEARILVEGMPDRIGIASDLFLKIGEAGVVVDVIVQNTAKDGTIDISFTCLRDDLSKTLHLLEEMKTELQYQSIESDSRITKISVIGNGMRSHSGVAARMFKALSANQINIQMISTSEIKISCVMDEKFIEKAVQCLHAEFNLDKVNDNTSRETVC